MKYGNVVTGAFISRPNRFIANVCLEGVPVVAHVKNTGRCRKCIWKNRIVHREKLLMIS